MAKAMIRRRLQRFLTSASWVLLVGGGAFIVAATGAIATSIPISWWPIAGAVAGLLLLVAQAYFEYRRRTYDPTWALKFDETFNGSAMKQARSKAAKVLKKEQGNLRRRDSGLAEIDDVLDFFEDLGFYEHGLHISAEVAHHAFYHWIRGYYLAARDYLEAWQEMEPARWQYVKGLFDVTNEIEAERSRGREIKALSGDQISTFLDDEIGLVAEGV